MNVNAFSLFGTEEALMETLAFRELNEWGPLTNKVRSYKATI